MSRFCERNEGIFLVFLENYSPKFKPGSFVKQGKKIQTFTFSCSFALCNLFLPRSRRIASHRIARPPAVRRIRGQEEEIRRCALTHEGGKETKEISLTNDDPLSITRRRKLEKLFLQRNSAFPPRNARECHLSMTRISAFVAFLVRNIVFVSQGQVFFSKPFNYS